jgi:mono/diheme cytochrome c family protein
LSIPAYHPPVQPVADPHALAEAAQMLVGAQNPVIVVDRAVSSQTAMDGIAALAELIGTPVLNRASRICMATEHPLNLTGMEHALVSKADVLLFLGVDEVWGTLYSLSDTVSRPTRRIAKPDAKVITIGIDDYDARGNIQDLQHAVDVDLPIIGDPESSVPYLIEALKQALGPGSHDAIGQRAAAAKKDHAALRARYRHDAAFGWDASPVSVARLTAELNELLSGERWSVITNMAEFLNNWPQKLWNITRWNQFQANSGAGGLGFAVPSAIGAALALKGTGIIPVVLQTDGDFMFVNSSLWTAAHHRVPLLIVMHNNRAYHAEHMNIQRMANQRQRGVTNTDLGTTDHRSADRLRHAGAQHGRTGNRPDHRSGEVAASPQRGARRRNRRSSGARRRRYAAEVMIMTIALRFTFIACGLGLVAMSSASSFAAADEAALGQHLYTANNCYLCHGTVGQGGAGPRIAPPDLSATPGFMAYVRHPTGIMPPNTTTVLSDADLAAIHGNLQSLPQPSNSPDLLSRSTVANPK